MSQSLSHLREALSRPPAGSQPRKPTSVPPMPLDAILKRAQDRLRGRPENWRDHVRRWVREFDWGFAFLLVCIVGWCSCEIVIQLARIAEKSP